LHFSLLPLFTYNRIGNLVLFESYREYQKFRDKQKKQFNVGLPCISGIYTRLTFFDTFILGPRKCSVLPQNISWLRYRVMSACRVYHGFRPAQLFKTVSKIVKRDLKIITSLIMPSLSQNLRSAWFKCVSDFHFWFGCFNLDFLSE